MTRIKLNDDSIPLWVRINECVRLIDSAVSEARRRGVVMVEKEAAYYTAKSQEAFELLESGYANTLIQQVIKGRPKVSEAMSAFHAAEVEYKNANEAIQAYKMTLRVLENEMQREWEQSKRM